MSGIGGIPFTPQTTSLEKYHSNKDEEESSDESYDESLLPQQPVPGFRIIDDTPALPELKINIQSIGAMALMRGLGETDAEFRMRANLFERIIVTQYKDVATQYSAVLTNKVMKGARYEESVEAICVQIAQAIGLRLQ